MYDILSVSNEAEMTLGSTQSTGAKFQKLVEISFWFMNNHEADHSRIAYHGREINQHL